MPVRVPASLSLSITPLFHTMFKTYLSIMSFPLQTAGITLHPDCVDGLTRISDFDLVFLVSCASPTGCPSVSDRTLNIS